MNKNNPYIQIREEEKCFAKTHLAEVLNVSPSTVNKWIKKGRLPNPSGYKHRFTKKDIESSFDMLNYTPIIKLDKKRKKNWDELKNSSFTIVNGGIFNISPLSNGDIQGMNEMIQEMGLWNAQGMNNHEHMKDFTKNPILQLILSKELIDCWINKIKELRPPKNKVIIYWNGSVDSILCIYMMPEINDDFLNNFDKYLRMRNSIITEVPL